jgi:hypothetical protein
MIPCLYTPNIGVDLYQPKRRCVFVQREFCHPGGDSSHNTTHIGMCALHATHTTSMTDTARTATVTPAGLLLILFTRYAARSPAAGFLSETGENEHTGYMCVRPIRRPVILFTRAIIRTSPKLQHGTSHGRRRRVMTTTAHINDRANHLVHTLTLVYNTPVSKTQVSRGCHR